MKKSLYLAILAIVIMPLTANAQNEYIKPPQDICDLMLAKPVPSAVFNDQYTMAVVTERNSPYIPLAEIVAMEEYKVGGERIDARNFSASRYKSVINGISLISVPGGRKTSIAGVPEDKGVYDIKWSADGSFFCFLNRTPNEIELYRVVVTDPKPKAVKINTHKVNEAFGTAYFILKNGSVLYKSVPDDIGPFPTAGVPKGPIFQATGGKTDRHRTHEDLIRSAFDEDVYSYLCTSVLSVWSGNRTRTIGTRQIFRSIYPSPDGRFLMVTTEHKPFSYSKLHNSFPSVKEIWDINGKVVKVISKSGDEDNETAGKNVTRSSYEWRTDLPSTLTWIESEKKGNEKDSTGKSSLTTLKQCQEPFDLDNGTVILRPEYSISEIFWGNSHFAAYNETSKKDKFKRIVAFDPSDTAAAKHILFTRSTEPDTTGTFPAPSSPLMVKNAYGKSAIYIDPKRKYTYLTGNGRLDAQGDKMSFIDKVTLKDGKAEQVWTATAPRKEVIVGVSSISDKSLRFISRRESPKEVPNYYSVEVGKKGALTSTAVTRFANPLPQLSNVIDTFITYRRADGVKLSARLFLPPGYDREKDGKLPVFMWTYPYEYHCAAEAEKFHEMRYEFPVPSRTTHIMWATRGYAVVQDFSMPIISKTVDGNPNDDLVNQMVMNAEAIINYLDEQGIGDRNRVAVGGHSYGSFMTANLMTHTKLFKAGQAESGAFNRSLTPFGFQNEGRTYWQEKAMYDAISPFNYANKLSGHILLVHGTMDENNGTFPIQSERMYQAFAGHGKDAEYLQLPYEGHGYIYTENMLHLFGTTFNMLEKYVKNAKPQQKKSK